MFQPRAFGKASWTVRALSLRTVGRPHSHRCLPGRSGGRGLLSTIQHPARYHETSTRPAIHYKQKSHFGPQSMPTSWPIRASSTREIIEPGFATTHASSCESQPGTEGKSSFAKNTRTWKTSLRMWVS